MRICFVISATDSAAVDGLRPHVQRLREAGNQVWARLPFESPDAAEFAREGAERGADLIIAAGGDGTVHHVANGLHAHLCRTGKAPMLGIVPLGTGNDLAGALCISSDPAAAMEIALTGRPTPIDIASLNGGCFVNVSTGGVGAEATEEASDEVKRVLGRLAYLVTGLKKFAALDPSRARFSTPEGEVYHGPFLIFAVGNGPRTGGGNFLTPQAKLEDGLLDLCVVKEMSRMDLFKLLPDLRAGNHLNHPAVLYHRAREFTIEPEARISVNADGEPQAAERYVYGISPHRLTVMLPPELAATPGTPVD